MPEDTSGDESYLGDELDRQLAELTRGVAKEAQFREKSAAERAADAAKARKAASKAGRKAARRARAAGSGRRRVRTVVAAVAVAVLAAGGLIAWLKISPPGGAAGPDDTHVVRNGPVPPASSPPAGPPADPFAGTPAAGFAAGADGFVIPAARPVGGFTARQVRDAYVEVKKLLVAGLLDPRTLAGGAPDAFANLLLAQERGDFVRGLDKLGLKKGYPMSTRTWVVSFAPGTTRLVTSTIKTRATMSARVITSQGRPVLRIDVNALVVYAVEPPRQPADWMRIVAHPHWHVDFARYTDPGGALQPWVSAGQGVAGALCGIGDGYVHPDFPNGPAPKVRPTGTPVNPYAMAAAPVHPGCTASTGT